MVRRLVWEINPNLKFLNRTNEQNRTKTFVIKQILKISGQHLHYSFPHFHILNNEYHQ